MITAHVVHATASELNYWIEYENFGSVGVIETVCYDADGNVVVAAQVYPVVSEMQFVYAKTETVSFGSNGATAAKWAFAFYAGGASGPTMDPLQLVRPKPTLVEVPLSDSEAMYDISAASTAG